LAALKPWVNYMPRVKLDSTRMYSRPSLAPMMVGVDGRVGQSRYNTNRQFEYTLRQMAVSPFSVNSKAYMQRIRDEYGYTDDGTYETLGTIGGIVGAGIGGLATSGFVQSPLKINNPWFWKEGAIKTNNPWTGTYNPSRVARRTRFTKDIALLKTTQTDYNTIFEYTDKSLSNRKVAEEALTLAQKNFDDAEALLKTFNKGQRGVVDARKTVSETAEALTKAQKKVVTTTATYTTRARQLKKAADAAEAAGHTIKTGSKISSKLAGLAPRVGAVADAASLAMSSAGFVQSLKSGNALMIGLTGLETVLDTIDLVANFVPIPGVSGAIGIVAGVANIGVGALVGWLGGQTVGRSFSQEGARAQAMFAENLYSSMVHRPISSAGTIGVMAGLPLALGYLAGKKWGAVSIASRWLTTNAIGNQTRAGVSMMTMQAINALTDPLDQRLPWAPENPEDMNFVSAISLYGDINDNLYGATMRKSILVGALSGREQDMIDAFTRSWGMHDDIYKSVMFDDVRQAAGIDIGPLGNSLISTIGEILIDPQNAFEVNIKGMEDNISRKVAVNLAKRLDISEAQVMMQGGKAKGATLEKLVEDAGLLRMRGTSKDRVRVLEGLVKAYLNDGETGLRKALADMAIGVVHGEDKTKYEVSIDDGKITGDILTKYFNDVFSGRDNTYTRTGLENIRKEYKEYKRLKNLKPDEITADELKTRSEITERVEKTERYLKRIYGNESQEILFSMFMNDRAITLKGSDILELYDAYTPMRHHMEMINSAAGVIMTVSNPMLKITNKLISGGRKTDALGRFRFASLKQKQKLLTELKELKDNKDKIKTLTDAHKAQEEKVKANKKSLDSIIESQTLVEDSELDAELISDVNAANTKNTEDYVKAKAALELARQDLKRMEEEIKQIKDNTIYYHRQDYTNKKTKRVTIIKQDELDVSEKHLKDLLTQLGVEEKNIEEDLRRLKKSNSESIRDLAEEAYDLYTALTNYYFSNIDNTYVTNILEKTQSVLTLLDLSETELNDNLVSVLNSIHIFKRFTNSLQTGKESDLLSKHVRDTKAQIIKLTDQHTKLKTELNTIAVDKDKEVERVIKRTEINIKGKLTDEAKKNLDFTKNTTYQSLQAKELETVDKIADIEKDITQLNESVTRNETRVHYLTKTKAGKAENRTISTRVFSASNYKLLGSKAAKGMDLLAKNLLTNGQRIVLTDENGRQIYINSLEEYQVKRGELLTTPLALEVEYTPEQIIMRYMMTYIDATDLEILTRTSLEVPASFFDDWKSLTQEAQYEKIIEVLDMIKGSLTKEAKANLYKAETIDEITQQISRQGFHGHFVQINDLDYNVLRSYIIGKLLKRKDSQTATIFNTVKALLKEIDDEFVVLQGTDAFKTSPQLELMLLKRIYSLNTQLHNNNTFRYFKALIKPYRQAKEKLGLFISNEVSDISVSKEYKKVLKDLKENENKHPYKAYEVLVKTFESPILKKEVENAQRNVDRFRDASAVQAGTATPEQVDSVSKNTTEINERKERIKKAKQKRDALHKNVKEEAKAQTKDMLDGVSIQDIHNFTADILLSENIMDSVLGKRLYALGYTTKKSQLVYIMNYLLSGKEIFELGLPEISYTLRQSRYKKYGSKGATFTPFYKVLDLFKKSRSSHKSYVYTKAFQIVRMIKESGGNIQFKNGVLDISYTKDATKRVSIDLAKLPPLKMYGASAEQLLAHRIVLAYTTGSEEVVVKVQADKHTNAEVSGMLKRSLFNAVKQWMIANATSPLISKEMLFKSGDIFTNEDIRLFMKLLDVDNPNKEENKAITEIFKILVGEVNKELYNYNGSYAQLKLMDIADELFNYEQKDIQGITDMYLTVARDVPKKEIFGNDLIVPLLDDILSGGVGAKTSLFGILNDVQQFISEDHARKKKLNIYDIEDYTIIDNEVWFKFKGITNTITMYEVMYDYKINYEDIQNIARHVTSNKKGITAQLSTEDRIKIIANYNSKLVQYGSLLSRHTFDLSKEEFLKLPGVTEADYNLLTANDYNVLYDLLRTDEVLNTVKSTGTVEVYDQATGTTRRVQADMYDRNENMQTYLGKRVLDLYSKAKADAIKAGNKNTMELFLSYLLTADNTYIGKERKLKVLKHIFFHGHHVVSAFASDTKIEELEGKLKGSIKHASDRRIYEAQLAELKEIRDNIEHKELRNVDKFLEYIIQNPSKALEIYKNSVKTSSGNHAVVKHNGGYIVVSDKRMKSGNVDRSGWLGTITARNREIGEHVLKKQELPEARIESNNILNSSDNTLIKHIKDIGGSFVRVTKDGALLVVPDNVDADTLKEIYKKRYVLKSLFNTLDKVDTLHILTQKQYDGLGTLIKTRTTNGVTDYTQELKAIDDGKGGIKGRVLNIINTAAPTKVNAYQQDIENILKVKTSTKESTADVVKNLYRYGYLVNHHTLVKEAYSTDVGFYQTETYKTFKHKAFINKMFYDFVAHVDPTKKFDKINLEVLGSLFFKHSNIFKDIKTGEFYDVTNVSKEITNTEHLKKFKDIKIDGQDLITRIENALRYMQQTYGDTPQFKFTLDDVLDTEFLDILRDLTKKVRGIVQESNRAQNAMWYGLVKKHGANFERQENYNYTTGEELSELRKYTSTTDTALRNKDKHTYLYEVLNPWADLDKFDTAMGKVKTDFKEEDAEGNNKVAVAKSTIARIKAHHKRRKAILRGSGVSKNNKINLKEFWEGHKELVEMQAVLTQQNIIKEMGSFKLSDDTKKDLTKVSEILWDIYSQKQALTDKFLELKNTGIITTEEYEHAKIILNESFLDFDDVKLTSASDIYNYIVYSFYKSIDDKVHDRVHRDGLNTIVDRIAEQTTDAKGELDITNILKKTLGESRAKKVSYNYSQEILTNSEPLGNPDGIVYVPDTHEEYFADIYLEVLNYIDPDMLMDVRSTLVSVQKDIKEHMFGPRSYVDQKESTKPDTEEIKEYSDLKDYVESLSKDSNERLLAQYIIDVLILHKETPESLKEFSKAIVTEIKKKQGKIKFPPVDAGTVFHILNKNKRAQFKDSFDVYDTLATPVLDFDINFVQFIKEYFFGGSDKQQSRMLAHFGMHKDDLKYFEPNLKNNLNFIVRTILSRRLGEEGSIEEAYALTSVLNMLREQFVRADRILEQGKTFEEIQQLVPVIKTKYDLIRYFDKVKAAGVVPNDSSLTFSWGVVTQRYIIDPIADAIDASRALEYSGTFRNKGHNLFGNNLSDNIGDSSQFIYNALKFVEDENKLLKSVYIDPSETLPLQDITIDPVHVVKAETPIMTLTREVDRGFYSALFKPSNEMNLQGLQQMEYSRAQGVAVIDMMAEANAKDIEDVGSDKVVFHFIRGLFTDAFKVLRKYQKNEDFILIRDIGTALSAFASDSSLVNFYSRYLDRYILKNNTSNMDTKLNAEVDKIVNYFTDHASYLVNMDEKLARAIIGRIMVQRFDKYTGDGINDLVAETLKYHKEYLKGSKTLSGYTAKQIAAHLAAAKNKDDLITLIYSEDTTYKSLSVAEQQFIDAAISLSDLVKNEQRKLDPLRLVDTRDYGMRIDTEHGFEETAQGLIVKDLKKKLNSSKAQLSGLTSQQTARRNELGIDKQTNVSKKEGKLYNSYLNEISKKESLENYRTFLKQTYQYNKDALLNDVIFHMPELFQEVLDDKYKAIELEQQKIIEEYNELEIKYKQVVIEEFKRRRALKNLSEDLYTSSIWYLYKDIRNFLNLPRDEYLKISEQDVERIKKEFKNRFNVVNLYTTTMNEKYGSQLKDTSDIVAWIESMNTLRTDLQEVDTWKKGGENYDPNLTDTDGKKISFLKAQKDLTKKYVELETRTKNNNEYFNKLPDDQSTMSLNIKQKILRDHIASIVSMDKAEHKAAIKKFFEDNQAEFTEKTKEDMKTLVKNKQAGIEKILRTVYQTLLYKHGIDLDIMTAEAGTIERAFDVALAVYKSKANLFTDDKYTTELKGLLKSILVQKKHYNHNISLLETLDNTRSLDIYDYLLNIAKEEFKHLPVNDDALLALTLYLSGDDSEHDRNQLKEIDDKIAMQKDKVSEAESNYNKINTYIYEAPEQIKEVKENIAELEETLQAANVAYSTLKDYHKTEKPNNNTNVGTYKQLYGVKTTDEVINKIIKDAGAMTEGGEEAIRKAIREASYDPKNTTNDIYLHNDVVDSLITFFNHKKINEKTNKYNFKTIHILDLETLTEETGTITPYQMTVIRVEYDANGKEKLAINTAYFNNHVFYADADNKALVDFYALQEKIHLDEALRLKQEKNPKIVALTEPEIATLKAEAKQRTDKLVDKIKHTKNEAVVMNVFMALLTSKQKPEEALLNPIVAHNGSRFDFYVYDDFVSKYGNKLLTNIYYQKIKEKSPSEIKKSLGVTSLSNAIIMELTPELLAKYDKALTDLHSKWARGILPTEEELDIVQQLREEIWTTRTLLEYEQALVNRQYAKDNTLLKELIHGENSEAAKIRKELKAYLKGDNTDRLEVINRLVDYFERGFKEITGEVEHDAIRKFVTDWLDESQIEYDKLKAGGAMEYTVSGTPSQRRRVLGAIREQVIRTQAEQDLIDSKKEKYRPQTIIDGYIFAMNNVDSLILNNLKIGDTIDDGIKVLTDQKTTLDQKIIEVNAYIRNTEIDIEAGVVTQQGILADISRLSGMINEHFSLPMYKAEKSINYFNMRRIYSREKSLIENELGYGLLDVQQTINVREMTEELDRVKRLISYIENPETANTKEIKNFLASKKIFSKMLDIKTKEDKALLITEIDKQIEQLREVLKLNVDTNKIALEDILLQRVDAYKQSLKKIVADQHALVVKLWNDPSTKKLVRNWSTVVIKEDTDLTTDLFDMAYGLLAKHSETVFKGKHIKDNPHYKQLINMFSTQSGLYKVLKTQNANLLDLSNNYEVIQTINKVIEQQIASLEIDKQTVEDLELGAQDALRSLNYTQIIHEFKQVMTKAKLVDDFDDMIQRDDIFNLLMRRGKSTKDMNKAEFNLETIKRKPPQMLEALDNKDIKRWYEDARMNDDVYGFVLDSTKVYDAPFEDGGETKHNITIYDEENDVTQHITFDRDADGKISNLKVEINYVYTTQERVYSKAKTFTRKFNLTGDNAYSLDDIISRLPSNKIAKDNAFLKGVETKHLYTPKGVDTSIQSILRLKTVYDNLFPNNKFNEDEYKKTVVLDKGDTGLHIKNMKLVNLTSKVREQFNLELQMIRMGHNKSTYEYQDMATLYVGLANKILGKFRALDPGKILNKIPESFSQDYILDYDQETLNNLGIELLASAEGSSGKTFTKLSKYSTTLSYLHNVNPTRTVLSLNKAYGMFAAQRIINDFFEAEDKYLDKNPDKSLDTVSVGTILNEMNLTEEQKKYVVKQTKDGEYIDMFTPNNGTRHMLNQYKNDNLHRKGINAMVAFSRDPRANRDAMLIDKDYAIAMGMDMHNKTWTGPYGFKGAIRYIPGLAKQYNGAVIVAESPSIMSRGSGGMLTDMAIGNIRKYLLEDFEGMPQEIVDKLRAIDTRLKTKTETPNGLSDLFTIEHGKLITDRVIDYFEYLNTNIGKDWQEIIIASKPGEFTLKNYKQEEKTISIDKYYIGELYVTLDAEHVAEHMATQAKRQAKGKDITMVKRDITGSVDKGVFLGPTVLQILQSKGGIDARAAFPADYTVLDRYTRLSVSGIKPFIAEIKARIGENASTEDILYELNKLELKQFKSEITQYLNEMEIYKASGNTDTYAALRMDLINKNIIQGAYESYTRRGGVLYKSMYKRYEGVREQYLANIDLGLGIVRMSKKGWNAQREIKKGWLQQELFDGWDAVVFDTEFGKRKGKSYIMTVNKESVKDYINKLDEQGIHEELNYTRKDNVFTFKKDKALDAYNFRNYGWMLSIRTPTQGYNAVPMIKNIGFNSGSAIETNIYLYDIMNADNDGDTMGILALDAKQYDILAPLVNGKRTGLDATQEDYYDAGYLEKMLDEFENKPFEPYETLDARYTYTGKQTHATNVRSNYTWDELYLTAFKDKAKDMIESEKAKDLEAVFMDKKTKAVYVNVMVRALNAGESYGVLKIDYKGTTAEIIKGDKRKGIADTYHDIDFLDKVYSDADIKQEIWNRYSFDQKVQRHDYTYGDMMIEADVNYYLKTIADDVKYEREDTFINRLSKDEKDLIMQHTAKEFLNSKNEDVVKLRNKLMFDKFHSMMTAQTIKRFQTSKRATAKVGAVRKNVYLSTTTIGIYDVNKINVSRDTVGTAKDPWAFARDDNNYVSVKNVIKALFNKNVEDIAKTAQTKEEFYKKVQGYINIGTVTHTVWTNENLKLLVYKMYENIKKRDQAIVELTSLNNALELYRKDKPKGMKALRTHLRGFGYTKSNNVSSIFRDIVLNWEAQNYEKEITDVDMMHLKGLYFGKFMKDANKFFTSADADDIKNLANTYLEQLVMDDRYLLGFYDALTQRAISMAKHEAVDSNLVLTAKQYYDSLKKIEDILSVRHINIGDDQNFGMAMMTDSKIFERYEIGPKDDDLQKRLDEASEDLNVNIIPKEVQGNSNDAIVNVNAVIKNIIKVSVHGNTAMPDVRFEKIYQSMLDIFEILNTTKDMDKAVEDDKFLAAIKHLLKEGIPVYRLQEALRLSLSAYRYANQLHYASKQTPLNINKLYLLKDRAFFIELMYKLNTPQFQKDFDNRYKGVVLDFFRNKDALDLFIYDEDDAGETTVRAVNTTETRDPVYEKDTLYDLLLNSGDDITQETYNRIFENLDSSERMIIETTLKELNAYGVYNHKSLEEFLSESLHRYAFLENAYKANIDNQERAKTLTIEEIQKKEITKNAFDVRSIVPTLREVAYKNNKHQEALNKQKEYQSQLVNLQIEKGIIENTLRTIQSDIDFYRSLNSTDNTLLDKLRTLVVNLKAKAERIDDQMVNYVYDNTFKGLLLLHNNKGENYYNITFNKPEKLSHLVQKDLDDFRNSNLLNLHKWQTPFYYIVELFTMNNKVDYDMFYDWYRHNERFHRATVVMDAFDDETLLRLLNNYIKKNDPNWDELSNEDKQKFLKQRKHYIASRFTSLDDKKDPNSLDKFIKEIHNFKEEIFKWYSKTEGYKGTKEELVGLTKIFNNTKLIDAFYNKVLNEQPTFKDGTEIEKYMKTLNDGKDITIVKLNGKLYNGIATGINLKQQLSPTMKEINIRSAKDLRELHEFVIANGNEYLIGFTDLNNFMNATEQAYNPYKFTGAGATTIALLQHAQKLLMRITPGFLFRNYIDTWNQLFSHMYVEQGLYGMMVNTKQILHYMGMTHKIYSVYNYINEERILALNEIMLRVSDMNKLLENRKNTPLTKDTVTYVEKTVSYLKDKLTVYLTASQKLPNTDSTNRIVNNRKQAELLLARLDKLTADIISKTSKDINLIRIYKDHDVINDVVNLMVNIRFAEFFVMFDDLKIGVNKDGEPRKLYEQIRDHEINSRRRKISKIKDSIESSNFEDFKHILFEISAFMQTNAQVDVYKQESFKYLYDAVNQRRNLETIGTELLSTKDAVEILNKERKTLHTRLADIIKNPLSLMNVPKMLLNGTEALYDVYDKLNSDIENTGRIAGYLFDRYMHGYTFNETVNKSLKRWFNYGQRSGLEMQNIADTPYLSFPIRSIDNWIERLMNPSYMRLMSDVIDGVYGQYADEDGQYSEYEQFQIMNGWIPITKSWGIRFGHGAFDVQALLSSPATSMAQRSNPIIRAVKALQETGDINKGLKQLATVGAVSQYLNMLGPREDLQQSGMGEFVTTRPRSIGSSTNFLFDQYDSSKGYGYEKYTPHKYRNNNGRYRYYENVYKDWFNKYGRMRKPTVDPYSLVKNIQWEHYVRKRQRQNILR
jgi:hypothetical protein